MLRLERTNATNLNFIDLVKLLDSELAVRDGDDHDFYNQFNSIQGMDYCMVAYQDEQPAGCGAIKPFNDTMVEVKRMYTKIDFRGRGIAISLLAGLEAWAKELNYGYCILETGINQPEAIALYHKCGYERVANYGQYEGVATSYCFKKKLIT